MQFYDGSPVFTTYTDKLKNMSKSDLILECLHWKSNHDNIAKQARALTIRPDIPVERLKLYKDCETLKKLKPEYVKQSPPVDFMFNTNDVVYNVLADFYKKLEQTMHDELSKHGVTIDDEDLQFNTFTWAGVTMYCATKDNKKLFDVITDRNLKISVVQ